MGYDMAETLYNTTVAIAIVGTTGTTPYTLAQGSSLNSTGFAALTYVTISNVGNLGPTGKDVNIISYPTLDDTVVQKGTGLVNGGESEIEYLTDDNDTGQDILRTACGQSNNGNNFAFRIQNASGRKYYNLGIAVGPQNLHGGVESFVRQKVKLAFNQAEIMV